MATKKAEWLTREQIESVRDRMSADDLIEGIGDGSKPGVRIAIDTFNAAAKRLGLANGTTASAQVRASDFSFLAEMIGEAVSLDSPKADSTPASLPSADTGE